MKTIPLRLTEEQYDVLRALAFEGRISMAELVRRAVEKAYGEDARRVRERRAQYLVPNGETEETLRDYTEEEIAQFLAEDTIDETTAQAVRRLLAQGKL